MPRALHRLLRSVLDSDRDATRVDDEWHTRCLHCRTRLTLTAGGAPIGDASLEHIVPRSWFGLRAAAPFTDTLAGADDVRNLAVACARCNQQKGCGPDQRGPHDAGARDVIARLLARRQARFVAPGGGTGRT